MAVELYWTSPLRNMSGVNVYVTRLASTVEVKSPSRRLTQLIDAAGSNESFGDSSTRPLVTLTVFLFPL